MNQAGAFTKSATAFTSSKPQSTSTTYQGYARVSKLTSPQSSSFFVKPPHMQDPDYFKHHATKPATDNKTIALNDLEDGVKLTILSDIERDQRLNDLKDVLKRDYERTTAKQTELENKRKADHEMFDEFVKKAREQNSVMEEQYGLKCLEHLKLQKSYDELEQKYTDALCDIDGGVFWNNSLKTLLAMKNEEIDNLKKALASKNSHPSSPGINSLLGIMDNQKMVEGTGSSVNIITAPDVTLKKKPEQNKNVDKDDEEHPNNLRFYVKKPIVRVTDPAILYALNFMSDNVYSYVRPPFKGINIDGVRYAFYSSTAKEISA